MRCDATTKGVAPRARDPKTGKPLVIEIKCQLLKGHMGPHLNGVSAQRFGDQIVRGAGTGSKDWE